MQQISVHPNGGVSWWRDMDTTERFVSTLLHLLVAHNIEKDFSIRIFFT